MTPNAEFKGRPLFNMEHRGNGIRSGRSYNGVLCNLSNGVISNDLESSRKQ